MLFRDILKHGVRHFIALLGAMACLFLQSQSALGAPPVDWKAAIATRLRGGGLYVADSDGKEVLAIRADDKFIPASILKVATVSAALEAFGADHHFETEFYRDKQDNLYVRGLGDPMLVSEEIQIIAEQLREKMPKVRDVVLDDTYFANDVRVDGAGGSLNPYDAANGALVANFNTIFIEKQRGGKIIIAEPQTPLTETALSLGATIKSGKERINLGGDAHRGTKYFGEILVAFLKRADVNVSGNLRLEKVPASLKPFYTHQSTHSVADISRELLKYSTNYLANQLLILMGAKTYGAPANVAKGTRVLSDHLKSSVGWTDFSVNEGAGLSRKNYTSPRQMIKLLRHFAKYRQLLPETEDGILEKTGTLTGVSSLCGYFTKGGKLFYFALMMPVNLTHAQRLGIIREVRARVA